MTLGPALGPRRARQLWYVPLLGSAMALMLLRTLGMAAVLDVAGFAGFSAGLLVSSTFCMAGCLGVQALLQREWPVAIVRGRDLHGLVRAAQCQWIAAIGALVCLLGTALGAQVPGVDQLWLALGILHGWAHQAFLVASIESRSRGHMLRFAGVNLMRSVLALLPVVAVALATGSAALAFLLDAALTMGIAAWQVRAAHATGTWRVGLVLRLAWSRLSRIPWRMALWLSAAMGIAFVLANVDRWLAAMWLTAAGFAAYAFAWTLLSLGQALQTLINAAVFPMLARRFGDMGPGRAFALCWRVSLATLCAGAALALPVGWGLAWAVTRWYPQYVDALAVVPMFLAAAVLRLGDFWSSFLIIIGSERNLLVVQLVGALVAVLGWMMAREANWIDASGAHSVAALSLALALSGHVAVAAMGWRARGA